MVHIGWFLRIGAEPIESQPTPATQLVRGRTLTCEDKESGPTEKGSAHKGQKNCVIYDGPDGLWDNIKATDVGLFSVTVFMFLLGVGQVVLLWRQAGIMERQADTLPKIERAYLFVTVTGEPLRGSPSGMVACLQTVEIKNYGKTPAILRRFRGYPKTTAIAPQKLMDFDESEAEIPPGIVIAAGTTYPMQIRSNITNSQLGEIQGATTTHFICGIVEYEDRGGSGNSDSPIGGFPA